MKRTVTLGIIMLLLISCTISAVAAEIVHIDTFDDFEVTSDYTAIPETGTDMSDILGEGWHAWHSASEVNGLYGITSNSSFSSGSEGHSLYISPAMSLDKTGKYVGFEKILHEPYTSGKVTTDMRFYVGKNDSSSTPKTTTGLWGELNVFDQNDDSIFRFFLDSSKKVCLYIDSVSQAITDAVIPAGTFFDFSVTTDLDTNEITVVMHWQTSNRTSANNIAAFGVDGKYSLTYTDDGYATLKTISPVTPDTQFTSLKKARFSVCDNQNEYLRRNFLDYIRMHNVPDSTVTAVNALIGETSAEITGDTKVSVLSDTLLFEFNNVVTADETALVSYGDKEISCAVSSLSENQLAVKLPALQKETQYTVNILNVTNSIGKKQNIEYSFETSGAPIGFANVNAQRVEDKYIFNVDISNEYPNGSNVVLIAAQYLSNGKMKNVQSLDCELLHGNNEQLLELELKDCESGDYVVLMMWDSLSVEAGFHPIVLMKDGFRYNIE